MMNEYSEMINTYKARIEELEQHLSLHPDDYQAVINLLKLKSD